MPVLPAQQTDGSIRAGNLSIVPLQAAAVSWTAMPSTEFSQGYRIEFRPSAGGCAFSFELRAL